MLNVSLIENKPVTESWRTEFAKEDAKILEKMDMDRRARVFYEPRWQEYNYAYQAILFEYSLTRSFNPNIAPEYQVRRMFTEKDRKLSDYHLPVEFAIIIRQLADEMSNLPKTHWVSLTQSLGSRDGKSKIFNYLYDWNYYEVDGDLETFKTLLTKAIYGTSIEYIFQEYVTYPDFEPTGVVDGEVQYKEIQRVISRSRFRSMDIRKFWVDMNATNIREAEHCFLAENYGEDTFEQMFADTKKWDIAGIKPQPFREMFLSLGEIRKGQTPNGFQVIRWFDAVNNEMVLYANNRRINRKRMHLQIPSINGKPQLPVAVFYDSPLDQEFYGIGKCAVLKPFRQVKNKLRNAFFDISKKMAFNTLVIDPDSDFDENTYEFGQPFVRAIPDDVKPLPVSANLGPLIELDNKTDQDMIWATGVNFLDTSQGNASETATKTAVRKESQVKIVELGLKYNSIDGWKRRSMLMKQLIRLHLSSATILKVMDEAPEPLTIKTPGVQLKRNRKNPHKIYVEKTTTFGLFQLKATDLEDDVDLLLEVGNIAATKELKKARQLEAMEFIKSLAPPAPGSQLPYDQREVVKWAVEWGELPSEILPPGDKPLSEQDPKDILSNLPLIDKPPTHGDVLAGQNAAALTGQLTPNTGGRGPQIPTGPAPGPVPAAPMPVPGS